MSCQVGYGTCPGALTGSASSTFIQLMNTIMASQCAFETTYSYQGSHKFGRWNAPYDIFDIVIVGGGSSGAVLANRLSADTNLSILLVESGGMPTSTSEIPYLFAENDQVWNYSTEQSETSCKGYKNKKCIIRSGKILGGTSSINNMLYNRGNKQDFDEWAQENPEWDWETVIEFYKKSEKYINENKNDKDHGYNGYLATSDTESDEVIKTLIMLGANDMGYAMSAAGTNIGYYDSLTNIEEGKRCSSAKAFLSKIKPARKNLYIATQSTVRKILYNTRKDTATGLIIDSQNYGQIIISVRREIILAAGPINTPLILMNSGIGPKDELKDVNIQAIVDLPVGKNVQDHAALNGVYIKIQSQDLDELYSDKQKIDNIYEYFTKGTGRYSGVGAASIVGFLNTIDTNSEYPNLLMNYNFFPKNCPILKKTMENVGLATETINKVVNANNQSHLLQIIPIIIKPKSRGQIIYRSHLSMPKIEMNYMKEIADAELMVSGLDIIDKYIKTLSLSMVNAEILDYNHSCGWNKTCMVHSSTSSGNNVGGSCKMGKRENGGVVDSHGKVYGMNGLRVADSSIMPTLTSGGTSAPVIMIGERIAEFVKQDHADAYTKVD